MCADGDISREVFRSKKKKLEDQILNLEKLNDECRQNILELEDIGAKDKRIDSLSEFIKMVTSFCLAAFRRGRSCSMALSTSAREVREIGRAHV